MRRDAKQAPQPADQPIDDIQGPLGGMQAKAADPVVSQKPAEDVKKPVEAEAPVKKVESLLAKPDASATSKKMTAATTTVAAVPSVPEPPKGAFIMQLAAVKSETAAQSEWNRVQKKYSALLGALPLLVQKADLGTRGTYYRIQTGPFPNKSTAQDLCLRLKQAGGDCIVKQR